MELIADWNVESPYTSDEPPSAGVRLAGLYRGPSDSRRQRRRAVAVVAGVNCIIVVDRPQVGRYWVPPAVNRSNKQQ